MNPALTNILNIGNSNNTLTGINNQNTPGLILSGQVSQGNIPSQMLEMYLNQFVSQYPEQLAQIRQAILEALQTGELTQQELNIIIQLATVAAQNPELYPYVRNFAIRQGIATEQDLPQQYDQGLVFVILLAARAIQADISTQNGISSSIISMAEGGEVPPSNRPDGTVLASMKGGEYVIPAHVVKMKGKEFFDSLIEKYNKK